MNIDFMLLVFVFLGLGWLAGLGSIYQSDNIRFVKLVYFCLAFAFPPFSFVFLFRKLLVSDIKKAPQRLERSAEVLGKAASVTGHAIGKTADWLSKK